MRKRKWLEPILTLIAVAGLLAWLNRPAPHTPQPWNVPPPPPRDPGAPPPILPAAPEISAYRVSGIWLGMSPGEVEAARIQASPVQTRIDELGVAWVKGDAFAHKDVLLQRGSARALVRKHLGKPVGFNDSGSKWGYWTRGLPDTKMGILINFAGDSVESIELARDWSELAGHLLKP